MAREPLDLSGIRLGEWELKRRISSAQLADTYGARSDDGRTATVKVLLDKDERAQGRFARECAAYQQLAPSIAIQRYLTHGAIDDGFSYLIVEHLDGINLRDGAEYCQQLDLKRACRTMRELCLALETLHGAGIAHRNLRPETLLIGSTGQVALTNLGLVHDFSQRMAFPERCDLFTRGDVAWGPDVVTYVGRPDYFSPEHLRALKGDAVSWSPSADVYSLGLIFYRLLSGRERFPLGTPASQPGFVTILDAYTERRLNPASETVPGLARDAAPAAAIITRTLALDPHQRPADAAALRACIDAALADTVSAGDGDNGSIYDGFSGADLADISTQSIDTDALPESTLMRKQRASRLRELNQARQSLSQADLLPVIQAVTPPAPAAQTTPAVAQPQAPAERSAPAPAAPGGYRRTHTLPPTLPVQPTTPPVIPKTRITAPTVGPGSEPPLASSSDAASEPSPLSVAELVSSETDPFEAITASQPLTDSLTPPPQSAPAFQQENELYRTHTFLRPEAAIKEEARERRRKLLIALMLLIVVGGGVAALYLFVLR